MLIREITDNDKKAYYEMVLALDRETKFMMYEPGERQVGENAFRGKLQELRRNGSCMLVAEDYGRIVGFLEAERGAMRRIHHIAYISLGVIKEYRGQGVGKAFFEAIEEWAKSHNIVRLELTVLCENESAIALYRKMGYAIEGMRRCSMLVNQKYEDEYYMAKLL